MKERMRAHCSVYQLARHWGFPMGWTLVDKSGHQSEKCLDGSSALQMVQKKVFLKD